MAPNPFVYSRPVEPEELIDRQAEAQRLVELAEGGHHSRLSAPRRYGKTSLLGKVRADAESIGMASVYVNFYGILSIEDATQRIERGYRGLRGPLANWLAGVLRTLRPKTEIPGTGMSIEPTLEVVASERLAALLDLPVRMFTRTGRRALVIYDEFQAVLEARPPLDGLMRRVIEHHAKEASYVFAGSHPGMMRTLFEDRERVVSRPADNAARIEDIGVEIDRPGPLDRPEPLLDSNAREQFRVGVDRAEHASPGGHNSHVDLVNASVGEPQAQPMWPQGLDSTMRTTSVTAAGRSWPRAGAHVPAAS
ncbi:MAG: hypothetical protein WKF96_10180 [Solirubrobacteraceae bacterium]